MSNKLDPIDAKNISILDSIIYLFNKQDVTKPYAKKLTKVRNHYQKIASWYYRRSEPYIPFLNRYVIVVTEEKTYGILEKILPEFLVINTGKQTRKDGTSERYYIPIDKVIKIGRTECDI